MADTVKNLIRDAEWKTLASTCRLMVREQPQRAHWWYIHLGLALIEGRDFAGATRALDNANRGRGFCPLVAWYRGCLEYDRKEYAAALKIFRGLYQRYLLFKRGNWITNCWESERKADELGNDCRARIGFCYKHLENYPRAVRWLKEHLANRKRGQMSTYDKHVIAWYVEHLPSEKKK